MLHRHLILPLPNPHREALQVNNGSVLVDDNGELARVEVRRVIADPNDSIYTFKSLFNFRQSTGA